MSYQDHNLYGQLYSQILGKLKLPHYRTPLHQADVLSRSLSQKEAETEEISQRIGDQHFQLHSQLRRRLSSGAALPIPHSAPTAPVPSAIPTDETDVGEEVPVSEIVRDDDFHFLYPFLDWWWPDPPEGYIDPNAYLFLSRMPLWSPVNLKAVTMYETSSKDLYSTYRNVLLRCPKIDKDDVDSSSSVVHEPNEVFITEYSKALADSEKPRSPSEDKPGFVKMTTNAGTIACENYLVAHGSDWISELKKTAKENASSTSAGNEESLVNLSFDLSTALPAMPVDVPKPNHCFFRVCTPSYDWKNFDIALHDGNVSFSVKVGAITRVPVDPDPHWYDSNYLHTLAKHDSWNPPFTKNDIFGKKGLLCQRLCTFIAAYHIAFRVKVSPETYKKFEPSFKAARGCRIGPFHFGCGADVACEHSTHAGWKHNTNSDTLTFEGESLADYPTVIGVTVERILCDYGDK